MRLIAFVPCVAVCVFIATPRTAPFVGPAPLVPPTEPAAFASDMRAPVHHPSASDRNLRGFVDALRGATDDARVAFDVSQALEECFAVSRALPAQAHGLVSVTASVTWARQAAGEALAAPCRGFETQPIDPGDVLANLRRAADAGEPRALARMLLFRDVAQEKDDAMPLLPVLLASGDPGVVRDVGAFLARGEASRRVGGEEIPAVVVAIAWELAACDLGYACGPASRITLAQCAFAGACGAGNYEDALARTEPEEPLRQALRLRPAVVRALRAHDWPWLLGE